MANIDSQHSLNALEVIRCKGRSILQFDIGGEPTCNEQIFLECRPILYFLHIALWVMCTVAKFQSSMYNTF